MTDLLKTHAAPGSTDTARSRAVDTGMALTLLCLLAGFFTGRTGWFYSAATVLVVNMTAPKLFIPASRLWFGLSALMGSVMSRVILTLVFFLVLTPVGMLRRVMGKDALRLRAFKAGTDSVFTKRSGRFTAQDLTTPF